MFSEVFIKEIRATDADSPTSGNGQVEFDLTGAEGKFFIKKEYYDDQKRQYVAEVYTTEDANFNFENQNLYLMKVKNSSSHKMNDNYNCNDDK